MAVYVHPHMHVAYKSRPVSSLLSPVFLGDCAPHRERVYVSAFCMQTDELRVSARHVHAGLYVHFFPDVLFFFFSGWAKDGENQRRVGRMCRGVNTDITVLIRPSYLVAVRWPRGVKMHV